MRHITKSIKLKERFLLDNKVNKNTGLTGTDKGLTTVPAGPSVATIIAVITKNSTLVSAEALLDPGLSVTTEIAKGSYC